MQFDQVHREQPDINLSALIDITFILVIFIVLAANFHRINNLDVALPTADATSESDPESLVITVPPTGPAKIQGQDVAFTDLRSWLIDNRGQFRHVLLVADQEASVQRAVQILNDAQNAGFESVGIATQQPGTAQ